MVRGHDLAVEVKHAVDGVAEVDGTLSAAGQCLPQRVIGQGRQTSHCVTVTQTQGHFNNIQQDCHLENQLQMAGGQGSLLAYRESNLSI